MKRTALTALVIFFFLGTIFLTHSGVWAQANPLPDKEKPLREEKIIMRILITKIKEDLRTSSAAGISIEDDKEKVLFEKKSSDTLFLTRDGEAIKIKGEKNALPGVIVIKPLIEGAKISINGSQYRGRFKIINRDNLLELVNLVELEEYLYSVVPCEFRSTFPELSKTQAVVARTYALGHRGALEKFGYDFSSSTRYQVYKGYDVEDEISRRAVDATKGLVLAYDGALAKYPLYHSTCGGATAGNNSAFLSAPVPYLASVKCTHEPVEEKQNETDDTLEDETESMGLSQDQEDIPLGEEIPDDEPVKNNTPAVSDPLKDNEGLCYRSKYYRWQVVIDRKRLVDNINKANREKISRVDGIEIVRQCESGRVIELVFKTDKGPVKAEGDKIRGILTTEREKGDVGPLYSTLFKISKNGNNESWTIEGGGWGHGVGLCQFGALELARKGCVFTEILKKYYKGIEIVPYEDINAK